MTAQQMLNALPVVQKLMSLNLPIKKAHSVYSLAKQINEQREFFINEEKKLIEKFNAQVDQGGVIQFKDPNDQSEFSKEHNDLLAYEVVDVKPLELSFDDLGDAVFTPIELMQLENVISFID